MYDNMKREEYYGKLGAILHTLDRFDLQEDDRQALIWASLDYLELLGKVIGTESTK